MNWYTARCLFRSEHENGFNRRRQLVEYRYFLLRAKDDKSASKKARTLAKSKEHSYLNASGVRVSWTLERVIDIKEILANRLSEGTEVYYKYSHRQASKGSG
jgi:hypothetical protein